MESFWYTVHVALSVVWQLALMQAKNLVYREETDFRINLVQRCCCASPLLKLDHFDPDWSGFQFMLYHHMKWRDNWIGMLCIVSTVWLYCITTVLQVRCKLVHAIWIFMYNLLCIMYHVPEVWNMISNPTTIIHMGTVEWQESCRIFARYEQCILMKLHTKVIRKSSGFRGVLKMPCLSIWMWVASQSRQLYFTFQCVPC